MMCSPEKEKKKNVCARCDVLQLTCVSVQSDMVGTCVRERSATTSVEIIYRSRRSTQTTVQIVMVVRQEYFIVPSIDIHTRPNEETRQCTSDTSKLFYYLYEAERKKYANVKGMRKTCREADFRPKYDALSGAESARHARITITIRDNTYITNFYIITLSYMQKYRGFLTQIRQKLHREMILKRSESQW